MLAVTSLSGCASALLDPDKDGGSDQFTITGTKLVLSKDAFKKVEIVDLICRNLPPSAQAQMNQMKGCDGIQDSPDKLNQVLALFNSCYGAAGLAAHAEACAPVANSGNAGLSLVVLASYAPTTKSEVDAAKAAVFAVAAKVEKLTVDPNPADEETKATNKKTQLAKAAAARAKLAAGEAANAVLSAKSYIDVDDKISNSGEAKLWGATTNNGQAAAKLYEARAALDGLYQFLVELAEEDTAKEASLARGLVATALTRVELVNTAVANRQEQGKAHRTAIQEAIILAADRRCEIVKQVITTAKSESSFWSTMVSSVSGIAGALVNDSASRYFSGVAGGSAAAGAAWDNAYFQGQTTNLILHGINTARLNMRTKLIDPKRSASLAEYPLEEAIGHALQYNAECSIPAALHAVNAELQKAPDVNAITAAQMVRVFRMRCAEDAARKAGQERVDELKLCAAGAEEYGKLVAEQLGASKPQDVK